MTLFVGTWKIMDTARVPCMTYFASMTKEDDLAELNGVELLGRWSDVGNASGVCIFKADKYSDAMSWLYNWVPMATCSVKPVCDDNVARRIILGKEPEYHVDYSHVGDEPVENEVLYYITYKFHKDKKVEGNKLFASLTQEQDNADSGNCRPLGRWHDLGNGSGLAVAAAKSEEDVYKWAFNWTEMCDCSVVPVLTDAQTRSVIKNKTGFEQKLEAVKASMGGTQTSV